MDDLQAAADTEHGPPRQVKLSEQANSIQSCARVGASRNARRSEPGPESPYGSRDRLPGPLGRAGCNTAATAQNLQFLEVTARVPWLLATAEAGRRLHYGPPYSSAMSAM